MLPTCHNVSSVCWAFVCDFRYYYKIGHELQDGSVVWGKPYTFRAPPSPGQNSLQRVIVFGDMGKVTKSLTMMHGLFSSDPLAV